MKKENVSVTCLRVATSILLVLLTIAILVRLDNNRRQSSLRKINRTEPSESPKVAWQVDCPLIINGPFTHGFVKESFQKKFAKTLFGQRFDEVRNGGWWSPKDCRPVHEYVAVIVPIRRRKLQLETYLSLIHPYLQLQKIPHVVITVEQPEDQKFNKGLIVNMGILYTPEWINCFILADVDMIPNRLENMFTCNMTVPKSLLSGSSFHSNYRQIFSENFGGILALTRQQLYKINGFSTLYWGWGDEDNDMYLRAIHFYGQIYRVPYEVGLISHLDHPRQVPINDGPLRRKILRSGYDYNLDGLTNTRSQCSLTKIEKFPLRTALSIECAYRPISEIEKFIGVKLS